MLTLIIFFASQTPSPPPFPSPFPSPSGGEGGGGEGGGGEGGGGSESAVPNGEYACVPGELCDPMFVQEHLLPIMFWLLLIVLVPNTIAAIYATWHIRHRPDETVSWWASYKSALGCLCCFVLAFVGGALRGGGGGGHDHHHADHHEDHL